MLSLIQASSAALADQFKPAVTTCRAARLQVESAISKRDDLPIVHRVANRKRSDHHLRRNVMLQRVLPLCIIALCSVLEAQVAPEYSSVALAKEPAAFGNIDLKRLRLSLQYLQEEVGQTKTEPPGMLLIHLSKQTAEALGLRDGIFLQRATELDHSQTYYEVVLTGEYATRAYVLIAEEILENHYGLSLDDTARNVLVDRVTRKVNAAVKTPELQHSSTLQNTEAVSSRRPPSMSK